MDALMVGSVVVLIPFVAVVPFLWLAERIERGRAEVRARQIRLTDAVHWRLGAIAAPMVVKRPWGRWEVRVALPFGRPEVVGPVVSILHETLASIDRRAAERAEIVVTPQAPLPAPLAPPRRPVTRVRPTRTHVEACSR
jgi:hypothetical protein